MSESDVSARSATHLQRVLDKARLDSFVVFSDSLQLCFTADEDRENNLIWLTETSRLVMLAEGLVVTERSTIVGLLQCMIGLRVKSVDLQRSGVLALFFGDQLLRIAPDTINLERIWSVTPATPDSAGPHAWRVSLNDQLEVEFKAPD